MSLIQVQFKENVFFDILSAEVVRKDFSSFFKLQLGSEGRIERIEPGPINFSDGDGKIIEQYKAGIGELLCKAKISVYYTTLAAAKVAGSLKSPATQKIECQAWIKLTGGILPESHVPQVNLVIVGIEISDVFQNFYHSEKLPFAFESSGVKFEFLTLLRGSGVVEFRLATNAADMLYGPVVNQILNNADWGMFTEGQTLAAAVAKALNDSVHKIVNDSDDLGVEYDANGVWIPDNPFAGIGVPIFRYPIAVAATGVFYKTDLVDIPIKFSSFVEFSITADLNLLTRTTITWEIDNLFSVFSGINSIVSQIILSKFKPPSDQKVIEKNEDHIILENTTKLNAPSSSAFKGYVDVAVIDQTGAHVSGHIKVSPIPSADFSIDKHFWEGGLDCNKVDFVYTKTAPSVIIVGKPLDFEIKVDVQIEGPANLWKWEAKIYPPLKNIVHIVFTTHDESYDPTGTKLSAFIDTNAGIRWVDFGIVPPRPQSTSIESKKYAISQCKAKSRSWSDGKINISWVFDPPFDYRQIHLREWTIAINDFVGKNTIQLLAKSARGERHLLSIQPNNQTMYVQVITDADETLYIPTEVRTRSGIPKVYQRWIIPWFKLPVSSDTIPLALTEDALWVKEGSQLGRIEFPNHFQLNGLVDNSIKIRSAQNTSEIPKRITQHLASRDVRSSTSIYQTVSRGRMVAVLHAGSIVLGFVSSTMPILFNKDIKLLKEKKTEE